MDYNTLENLDGGCLSVASDPLILYSHIPVIIISLLFGFFVLLKSKKLITGKILFSICLTYSLWAIFDLIVWTQFSFNRLLIFLWGFQDMLSVLLFVLTLYFIYVFLEKKDISIVKKLFIFLPILPVIFLTPTRLGVNLFYTSTCEAGESDIYMKYLLFLQLFVSFWIVSLFISRYRKCYDFDNKKQIKLLALGTGFYLLMISIVAIATNVSNNYSIELYSLFSIVPFLSILSYLVIKYQAFDIKVIAGQFLIVSLWIAVFSQFFIVQSSFNLWITIVELAIITVLGWFLFRSVKQEVQTAEELGIASNRLQGLNNKLRELDQAKSEFISIASHQLRTPLTSIKGFSSLILENTFGRLPAKIKQPIENIFVNNEKLVLLVEDMLNVSRLEAGRLQYDLEETEVLPLVKKTVDNLRLYAKSKKLKMQLLESKEKLPLILADQRKLAEIIANLIDNAIKYTPHGQIEIIVEKFKKLQKVGIGKNPGIFNGSWIKIQVKDTGIGMTKEETKSIFEKFQQGPVDQRNSLQTVGTGLGVFISRQMAEAMNGHLYAESAGLGRGSAFILELPGLKGKR